MVTPPSWWSIISLYDGWAGCCAFCVSPSTPLSNLLFFAIMHKYPHCILGGTYA